MAPSLPWMPGGPIFRGKAMICDKEAEIRNLANWCIVCSRSSPKVAEFFAEQARLACVKLAALVAAR